jgi:hypothetical protein
MPGAAWQRSCCSVGCGHIGAVTTHVEVLFRCPPQDMIACTGGEQATAAGAAGAAAGVPGSSQGVRQTLSRSTSGSSSSNQGWSSTLAAAAAVPSGNAQASLQQHYSSQQQQLQQQQQGVGGSPCRLSEWAARPAGGGAVPLLLMGGADGSVRGWDLRVASLGQPWMATHPHTGTAGSTGLCVCASTLGCLLLCGMMLRGQQLHSAACYWIKMLKLSVHSTLLHLA